MILTTLEYSALMRAYWCYILNYEIPRWTRHILKNKLKLTRQSGIRKRF